MPTHSRPELLFCRLQIILHVLSVFGRQISRNLDRRIGSEYLLITIGMRWVKTASDRSLGRGYAVLRGTYLDTVVQFENHFCTCALDELRQRQQKQTGDNGRHSLEFVQGVLLDAQHVGSPSLGCGNE